jgi:hypothetical protein
MKKGGYMAWYWRNGKILTEKEAAKEGEKDLSGWASIILGGLAWVILYIFLGGFDTPFKRIVVVTAIAVASFIGWKFADWFWGIVAFLILGSVTFLFASWIFRWVVGAT